MISDTCGHRYKAGLNFRFKPDRQKCLEDLLQVNAGIAKLAAELS